VIRVVKEFDAEWMGGISSTAVAPPPNYYVYRR
jgi:hypothetical protein